MKQLRAKKLLFMIEDEKGATGSIDVDFDKTQHMSDKNIKRRKPAPRTFDTNRHGTRRESETRTRGTRAER